MEQNLSEAMFGSAFKARAFPVYSEMRERGPVARVALPNGESFCHVTRYAECLEFLKSHERFANDPANALSAQEYAVLFQQAAEGLTPERQEFLARTDEILSRNLLVVDLPDHSRLRRLVAIPFTPKYIEGLRARVQEIADYPDQRAVGAPGRAGRLRDAAVAPAEPGAGHPPRRGAVARRNVSARADAPARRVLIGAAVSTPPDGRRWPRAGRGCRRAAC